VHKWLHAHACNCGKEVLENPRQSGSGKLNRWFRIELEKVHPEGDWWRDVGCPTGSWVCSDVCYDKVDTVEFECVWDGLLIPSILHSCRSNEAVYLT
jgi:hypothetical protein